MKRPDLRERERERMKHQTSALCYLKILIGLVCNVPSGSKMTRSTTEELLNNNQLELS